MDFICENTVTELKFWHGKFEKLYEKLGHTRDDENGTRKDENRMELKMKQTTQ